MTRLSVLERKLTKEVPESLEELKARVDCVSQLSTKNAESADSGRKILEQRVNEIGYEIASLTKNTIARESIERNDESKNVAVYNIREDLIKPHRIHTGSEEEAIGACLRHLAKSTVGNLDERDVKSVRRINSKGPNSNKSAIITFVSVGDAQKFESRLNQAVMRTGRTKGNREARSRRMMYARTGLTTLQRSLLTEAEIMTSSESTQPRDVRQRKQNIAKLTDWSNLETPKEVRQGLVYYMKTTKTMGN
jgi:hypothetical protein